MTLPTILLGVLALIGCLGTIYAFNKYVSASAGESGALRRADDSERERNTLHTELSIAREENKKLHADVLVASQEAAELSGRVEQERTRYDEKLDAIESRYREEAERDRVAVEEAQKRSVETFDALAAKALASSNEQFIKLAKTTFESHNKDANKNLDDKSKSFEQLIKPITESLKKTDEKLEALNKSRVETQSSLTKHLDLLSTHTDSLRVETGRLIQSLKAPHVRGRWGEMALRNAVEFAGMTEHCDFSTQVSVADDEGAMLRPDMTIRLPENRVVIVDAKAPIHAYIESMEAETDERRADRLKAHARQLRSRVDDLVSKGYQSQFDHTPDFVVLFVPGDQFLSAAFREDPNLLEYAMTKGVILTTPATLIALLKAVSFGWAQASLADDARAILDMGRTMHQRIARLTALLKPLGTRLNSTVNAYNEVIASAEGMLLPAARKLEERNAKSKNELEEFSQVMTQPRHAAPHIEPKELNEEASKPG